MNHNSAFLSNFLYIFLVIKYDFIFLCKIYTFNISNFSKDMSLTSAYSEARLLPFTLLNFTATAP